MSATETCLCIAYLQSTSTKAMDFIPRDTWQFKKGRMHKSLPIPLHMIQITRVKILFISSLPRANQPKRTILHRTHLKTDLLKNIFK